MRGGSGSFGGLKTTGALIASLLFSTAASAQSLELLGPRGAVSPDGFLVALAQRNAAGELVPADEPKVDAEGATLRPGPPRPPLKTFLVLPEPGAREVKVRASKGAARAERTFRLGPPAARVSLSLVGAAPVKGKDTSATFRVVLMDEHGAPDRESPPPVLQANVGKLAALEQTGPGEYRATYQLPETRFPEVAVVVAFAPWPHPSSIHGAVGSLLVPLASSIDLPGRTERNAQMSIEIAGVTYGPVKAGPDGRFSLPVVVPPGHRYARGVAVDRAGNKRVTRVDLMLPPTDQLACVMNPRRLPADGAARARIICATSDPYGAPTTSAKVELSASAGRRGERRTVAPGLYEWIYSAPTELSGTPVQLRASWREGRNVSRDELELSLVQGAAEQLEVRLDEPVVHFGGRAELTGRVKDSLGRGREGATLRVDVPQGQVAVRSEAAGRFRAEWSLPADGDPVAAEVRVSAFGPAGTDPARLSVWREAGALFAGVTDLSGWPVPRQRLQVGGQQVETGDDGAARLGALAPGEHELRHAEWSGLGTTLHVLPDGAVWPQGRRPGAAVALGVTLAPPVPVNVRVQVAGRQVTYWVEDPSGRLLEGREVAVSVTGGAAEARGSRGGKVSVVVGGRGAAQVSVCDLRTGVTAVAEVPR